MNYSTTWTLNISDKMSAPINVINDKGQKMATVFDNSLTNVGKKFEEATKKATSFGDCLKKLKPIDWQAVGMSIDKISERLTNVAEVGAKFEAGLLDVSAITGITGKDLDALGDKARNLAKTFGTDASENLETFKTILSRLGPQIGENKEALGNMGKYANTLSKTMGGDVVGATDALTTSMLQFKVDLNNPITAAKEMERMMNAMAAGAKEGASEVPQISAALVQAGGTAKLANVSFEETNAALQALAQGGKYGAEAGVGLRNVLIKMNAPSALSKDAVGVLKRYGVNMKTVSDASLPFAVRLKEIAKIGKDTDALAAVFGAENIQSAQVLVNSAQYQEELAQKITGTNVAYQQAETVMSGWTEKLKRAKAWVDDLKIGTFNFTSVLSAGFGGLSQTAQLVADMSTAYSGLAPVLKSTAIWLKGTALWQGIVTVTTKAYTAAQWLLNTALTANPIGIIIVAIGALVALVVVAIKHYNKWGAALLHFLGPVGMVINAFKKIYDHWESIKRAFQTEGIIGGLKRLGMVLLDAIMHPIEQILNLISKLPGALGRAGASARDELHRFRSSQNLVTKGEEGYAKKITVKGRVFIGSSNNSKYLSDVEKARNEGFTGGEAEYAEWKNNQSKNTGTVSASTFLGDDTKEKKGKNKKDSSSKTTKEKEGISMSGSGGARTINMTINMTNNFSVAKGIGNLQNVANKVVGSINDRLRDGLVAID